MKRILLLALTISLLGYVTAQNNTWDVYLQGQAIKSIAFENENVWAATDSFLVSLNTSDLSTTYYPYPDIVRDMTAFFIIDKNGVKWIVRSVWNFDDEPIIIDNIYSFDGKTWDKIEYNGNGPINSLVVDRKNNKWITNGGFFPHLHKLEQGSSIQFTSESSGMMCYSVWQTASDNQGNIWLGNTDCNPIDYAGYFPEMYLVRYDGENWTSFPGPSSYYSKIVSDDSGYLWIQSTNNHELVKWDLSDNSWTNYLTLNGEYVLEAIDGENNLWFTNSDNGIVSYDGKDWSFFTMSNSELPSNTVYQITIDSEGTKWIGTDNGLVSIELKEGRNLILEVKNENANRFALYPNPAHDFITLKMPEKLQNSTADIINIDGQVIQSYNLNSNQYRLDLSQFPAGVYLLRIQSMENQIIKKFVKQ
ncbi:T9SS type A sorting domain-containing protein [Maribellus mangrovi]|uniref:T9SS type A sorting domain-containing protein n=1 Tax=Maribellus mangrovi TaxID=3133146 RepID=UPI0030EECECD